MLFQRADETGCLKRHQPGQLQSPYGLLPLPRLKSNNEKKEQITDSELSYPKKLSYALGPPHKPPFFNMKGFPIEQTVLTQQNLRSALLASGSIPLVMSGVTDISGNPPGMYRDGGILDYHFDIDFSDQNSGLVLYPHYTDRIIPGWLDKKLSFRKPLPRNLEKVILIAPSKEFIHKLPCQKIPDRNDFFLFKGQDRRRISYWLSVINESRRLSDDFWDSVESGRIREWVKPMP